MAGPVIGGAVAGAILGDAYAKTKEKAAESVGVPTYDHGTIEDQLIVDMVAEILHIARKSAAIALAPDFRPAFLQQSGLQPFRLYRAGYKHVSLLTAVGFTLDCQTPIGVIKFPMSIGWNACDLPDETDMWIDTGGPTSLSVYFYYGDDSLDIQGV